MTETNNTPEKGGYALQFDLGTFEGFNFRESSAIDRVLTGDEVVNWDHDANGEAEFWPSGDNAGVSLLFKDRSAVTGPELLDLDKVLQELGDDSTFNCIRPVNPICSASAMTVRWRHEETATDG